MLLALVRHAQAVSNALKILSDEYDKFPLTEEGVSQAKRAAEELKKLKPEAVFSSPVLRARQTAEIIAESLGLKVALDERLRERGLGELNGKRVEENSEHWKLRLARAREQVRDLEGWESMQARMLDFLNDVRNRGYRVVVAVSHYDPIRALIGHVFGLSDFQAWGIMIPNASITLIAAKSPLKVLGIALPLIPDEVLESLKLQGLV
ncbi:MAG: 2,3-diphosphoglycerate-dependent phosphoglycerate mutase [Thermoprotei archaeon]